MKKNKKKKCGLLGFLIKFFGRLMLIFAAACAVTGAILKFIDYIKSKKSSSDNCDREFKEFFNFCGNKSELVSEDDVAGVISKNILAVTEIDISGSTLREDGFISVASTLSAVNIIVPSDVNVKIDGLNRYSKVENFVPEDSSLPTLYVVTKCLLSDIRISRQE